jgi:hypothetical protein
MPSQRIPAVFARGGTSKGVFFHAKDLPAETQARDDIFLRVLGSPDPYQRQLNGMGGGISSLSKAVIIERSARGDADIDYTFAQIAVDRPIVDYAQACGNLSSAVGPFAVDEGLVDVVDGLATVRVFSTNAGQIYHAHFAVKNGVTVEDGAYTMSGVGGQGAPVKLEYLRPGGAITGKFLPGDGAVQTVTVPGIGSVEVSLVDATNPVVFVAASAVGLVGTELPDAIEAMPGMMDKLDQLRRIGGVACAMASTPASVPLANPKVALLYAPCNYTTLSGASVATDSFDIGVRMVSMERIHRAVTGTGAMCLGAAAQVPDSVPHQLTRARHGEPIRIGSPSGVLDVSAGVSQTSAGAWDVDSITVYRTQRRLMEGWVRC